MAFTLPRGWILKLTCIGCVSTLIGCGSKPVPIPAPPKAVVVAAPSIVAIVSEPTTEKAKDLFGTIRGRYDASTTYRASFDPQVMAGFISGAAKDLTEVPARFAGQDEVWIKLTLNQTGIGFDAVRFGRPYDTADLVHAFALRSEDTPRLKWWAITKSGQQLNFPPAHTSQKLNISVADLPFDDANTFIFGHIAQQQIVPSQDYVIAFVIDGSEPLDIYVKLALFNKHMHKLPVITTSHHAAKALGLTLPFQLTSNASLTDQAFEELELHGPPAALKFLEDRLVGEDDWKAWHRYVHIANDYALELAEGEQVNEAMAVYISAAAGVRKLRDTPCPPDEKPCDLIPRMLYDEACALARGGRTTESIAALREAVTAGCADVAMIRGDDDLASLHDNDEFKRLITELEAR
jgi:hypothetical protein